MTDSLFGGATIEGMDLQSGLARFGGNQAIFLKVIKAFTDGIGKHMDTLAGLTEEGLSDYAITVHGVKGSCYSIGANLEGDMAKELEFAAKAGDFALVSEKNPLFIDRVRNTLVPALEKLVSDEGDAISGGAERKPEPDKALLAEALTAAESFDALRLQQIAEELDKYSYEKGGDLVSWFSEKVIAFEFDDIVERLKTIL